MKEARLYGSQDLRVEETHEPNVSSGQVKVKNPRTIVALGLYLVIPTGLEPAPPTLSILL